MPHFKEMPEDQVLAIISQYPDELSGEQRKQDAFLRQFQVCPNCHGRTLVKDIPTFGAFRNDAVIAAPLLRCTQCHHAFDPDTGLTLNRGDAVTEF